MLLLKKNGFVAAGIPVYHNVKVELYSIKVLMNLLSSSKGADS